VLGLETGHYTRENLIRQLALYARYGVTSIVSLGGDGPEAAALREEQDEDLDRARIWIAGEVIPSGTPEEAAAKATLARQIAQMEAAGADLIDIGAQTSRPRHALIPAAEEVRRLTAAFDVARAATTLPLSVDTFRTMIQLTEEVIS